MPKCNGCGANNAQVKLKKGKKNKCNSCASSPVKSPTKSKKDKEDIIVNELLAYCAHHYGNCARENLQRVLLQMFTCDDVIEAKQVLHTCGIDNPGPQNGHRDSTNRSALDAEVDDLLVMLGRLDEDGSVNPTFAAVDLSKIPSVSPEEAGNAASQAVQIRKLQDQMAGVIKALGQHEESLDSLMQVQSNTAAASYAKIVSSGGTDDAESGSSGNGSGEAKRKQQKFPTPRIQMSDAVKSKYTDSEGFVVQRDSYRKQEKDEKRQQRRVLGKSNGPNKLKGEPRKKDMVVKYVQKDYTEDDMLEHLVDNDISVWTNDIEIISHPDHPTHTFKIKVLMSEVDKMLDEDVWSEGIECSEWVYKKRDQTRF